MSNAEKSTLEKTIYVEKAASGGALLFGLLTKSAPAVSYGLLFLAAGWGAGKLLESTKKKE